MTKIRSDMNATIVRHGDDRGEGRGGPCGRGHPRGRQRPFRRSRDGSRLVQRTRLADDRLVRGGPSRRPGRAVLLHVGRSAGVLCSFLAHRQPRGLSGIPPPLDAWQFSDVSHGSAACSVCWGPLPEKARPSPGSRSIANTIASAIKRAIRTRRRTAAGGATCCGCFRDPRNRSGKRWWRPMERTCSGTRSSACLTRPSYSGTSGWGWSYLSAGWLGWDLRTGISLLVWGLFLRLVYVLHVTWLVNSASHIWGYRNYENAR